MGKKTIDTTDAPAAIGAYSQAVIVGNLAFISGQIPLRPGSSDLVSKGFVEQAKQVFMNLSAIATNAGADLNATVKFTVYLTDLSHFSKLNDIMADFVQAPYPARAVVEVSALPKNALIEIDAILSMD